MDSNLKSADSPEEQLSLLLFLGSWWLHPFKTLSFLHFPAWSHICVEVSVKTFGFGFLNSVCGAFEGASLIKSCFFALRVLCLCCWHHCAHFIFFFDVCFYLFFVLLSAQSVRAHSHTLFSPTHPPLIISRSGRHGRTAGWPRPSHALQPRQTSLYAAAVPRSPASLLMTRAKHLKKRANLRLSEFLSKTPLIARSDKAAVPFLVGRGGNVVG